MDQALEKKIAEGNGGGSLPGSPPASQKKRVFFVIALVVLTLAVCAGARVFWVALHYESTDDAFIDGHIIPVSSKVAGQITKVYVADNQEIKEGDMLFEIDPRDYQAKWEEQRARTVAAEAEASRAGTDVVRYAQLFTKDEVSRQQLDLANATARSTSAILEREKAAFSKADLDLSYTKVKTPEAGRVTRKSVEEGAYVQVGQALLSIVPSRVWVTANFKETQLTHIHAGQPVTLKVDAYPGHLFNGHVESIQAGTGERFSLLPPENATGNYVKVVQRVPVKIVFDDPVDPQYTLAPGMSVVPSVKVK